MVSVQSRTSWEKQIGGGKKYGVKSGIRPIEDELVKTIRWQSNLQSEKEVEESISSLSQVPEQHGLAERQKEGWEGLYIYWWGEGYYL